MAAQIGWPFFLRLFRTPLQTFMASHCLMFSNNAKKEHNEQFKVKRNLE